MVAVFVKILHKLKPSAPTQSLRRDGRPRPSSRAQLGNRLWP
jgi:hypothetical protein